MDLRKLNPLAQVSLAPMFMASAIGGVVMCVGMVASEEPGFESLLRSIVLFPFFGIASAAMVALLVVPLWLILRAFIGPGMFSVLLAVFAGAFGALLGTNEYPMLERVAYSAALLGLPAAVYSWLASTRSSNQ
jgi:hypothetical protein